MRTRLLIASLALALVGVFASPGVAQAKPAGDAETECIKLLEEGKKIDDCQKAPNPLVPGVNEIIWGGAAFAILLFVLWKRGLPPVRNMMKRREDRIREDLERAERARTEAEAEREQYQRQLAEARSEATRILEEARQSADEVKRLADRIRARGLVVGSLVAPVWPPTGGGSAIGNSARQRSYDPKSLASASRSCGAGSLCSPSPSKNNSWRIIEFIAISCSRLSPLTRKPPALA